MGYILVNEPTAEEASRAFDALDDAYGTDEFSEDEAKQVMTAHGFGPGMFSALVTSGSISET